MDTFEHRTIIAILAISLVAGGSAYLVAQKQQVDSPQQAARQQTSELVAAVGTLVQLPNEEPVVTTVEDTTQLHKQPFFAEVQKGDQVLVFNRARKAFIYSPRDHRIVTTMNLRSEPR